MTLQELEYIRKANEVLKDPETTPITAAKLCRVIAQIYTRHASELEFALIDRVDNRLYNTINN